jgi:hypothetical protein
MLRSFFHTRCILTCLFHNLEIVTVMGGEEAAGRERKRLDALPHCKRLHRDSTAWERRLQRCG